MYLAVPSPMANCPSTWSRCPTGEYERRVDTPAHGGPVRGGARGIEAQLSDQGITHFWRANLKSGVAYSTAGVEDSAGLAPTTIDRVQDVRANLFWTAHRLVDIAGEVLWGERANKNGSKGDAWRFQFALIYRLN